MTQTCTHKHAFCNRCFKSGTESLAFQCLTITGQECGVLLCFEPTLVHEPLEQEETGHRHSIRGSWHNQSLHECIICITPWNMSCNHTVFNSELPLRNWLVHAYLRKFRRRKLQVNRSGGCAGCVQLFQRWFPSRSNWQLGNGIQGSKVYRRLAEGYHERTVAFWFYRSNTSRTLLVLRR